MEKITIRILRKMAILIGVSITLTILLLMILILNNRKFEKETLKQEMSQKTTAEDIAESKVEEKREADEEVKRATREKYLIEKYDSKSMKAARKEIDSLTMEISKNPKIAELYFKRGNVYYKLYKMKMACTDYTKAIELNPKESKYYMSRAWTYSDDEIEKSENDFESAFKISKTSEMYLQRARFYFKQEKNDLAINYCEQAIKKNDRNERAYYYILDTYFENNENEKVIENADIYIKKFPKFYMGYIYKADAYYRKDKYNEAISTFNEGIIKFKNEPELYMKRGLLKGDNGDTDNAIKDLEVAIKLKTNEKWIYSTSYLKEGKIYEYLENYLKAIDLYEKSIETSVNNGLDEDKNNSIIIYKHLAELYEKINENAKAIECSEKVEELEEYRNILLGE